MQYTVFIGRFQPLHNPHLEIMRGALNAKYDKAQYPKSNPNRLIICLGSAFKSRTPKNPFTAEERELMILRCLSEDERSRVSIAYISDSDYDDTEWAMEIQQAVDLIIERDIEIDVADPDEANNSVRLVGHKKDDSSYYLDMFPQWKFIGISNMDDMHSTTIRDYYLNSKFDSNSFVVDEDVFSDMCMDHLPPPVFDWLIEFRDTASFELLKDEYTSIEQYKESWASSPYPPVFVTCDAVVIQSGHILLVRRRDAPGKGLWALPGGFVDYNETIKSAVVRELKEETQLKVPVAVLNSLVKDGDKNSAVFDKPDRSLRGRTITHAYCLRLNPGPLPKVKGSDDAEKAEWVPINQVLDYERELFEDHASIIKYFL